MPNEGQSQNPFEFHASEYDAWYDENANVFAAEVAALQAVQPEVRGNWIEVGVGTGRFAQALGIPVGIEPTHAMAQLATRRGIQVLNGSAESIPLKTSTVDAAFVITTLCFLKDLRIAFQEISRVLKPGGDLVLGHLPADSALGELLAEVGADDPFFAQASLWTRTDVLRALDAANFTLVEAKHTLVGPPSLLALRNRRYTTAPTTDRLPYSEPSQISGSTRNVLRIRLNLTLRLAGQ